MLRACLRPIAGSAAVAATAIAARPERAPFAPEEPSTVGQPPRCALRRFAPVHPVFPVWHDTLHCEVSKTLAAVTKEDVLAVQKSWANAIKRISQVHKEGGDYVKTAAEAAGELYAYGHFNVLFKPTKAADYQFRPTANEAMSYFVGAQAVDNGYDEDGGFAVNGGKGWSDCVYENHQIELKGDVAIAMGNYWFTDATTGAKSKVEYTFGYQRCTDGKVRIFLHHSSVPFNKQKTAPMKRMPSYRERD